MAQDGAELGSICTQKYEGKSTICPSKTFSFGFHNLFLWLVLVRVQILSYTQWANSHQCTGWLDRILFFIGFLSHMGSMVSNTFSLQGDMQYLSIIEKIQIFKRRYVISGICHKNCYKKNLTTSQIWLHLFFSPQLNKKQNLLLNIMCHLLLDCKGS